MTDTTTPPPAPSPQPPRQAVPVAVQVIDRLGELAAVVVGAWLCSLGKVTGLEWMFFSAAVLGIQNGFRTFGGRVVGPAGAAVLLLLPLGTLAERMSMVATRALLPLLGAGVLLLQGG